jgi:Zn-dependent protease
MIKTLLTLLTLGKLGFVLKTGGTMILSVGVYAFVFGWWYAVGIVLLIFVHEMGHFVSARQRGLAVGAPTFIPFVGAWVDLKDQPMNAETEAYIGIAGPIAGTVAAILCYWVANETDSKLWLALAYTGFMLNLFNLIPLLPLDGGRITNVLSPHIWWLGIPILVALFWVRPSPMLILVALLAAPHAWRALRGKRDEDVPPRYFDTPMRIRLIYGVWYLGLCAFLGFMTYELHELLVARRIE